MKQALINTLSFLENRHQKDIQLGLERMRVSAESLDLLPPLSKVITVAGTNGKGSTVALLESIYCAAGYSVAAYTSPHLLTFNERIKINGRAITDDELLHAFAMIEKTPWFDSLTYFEVTTLAALWHFQQHPIDLMILEVGLGGRLDATNIVDADLAIITTIDLDHQDWLGDTLEAIAREKSGILRADKPCIYADYNAPQSILSQAESLKAPLYRNGQEYFYETDDETMVFHYQEMTLALPKSIYHTNSQAAAVMACLCLRQSLPVSEEAIARGINNTLLPARMQLVDAGHHQILFDVAHNPQAARHLASRLSADFPDKRIHAVFSAFADKDIAGLTAPLKHLVSFWYPALMPGKRAASESQIISALCSSEINVTLCYNSAASAYQAACNNVLAGDLVLVYGSFVIVGLILSDSNPAGR